MHFVTTNEKRFYEEPHRLLLISTNNAGLIIKKILGNLKQKNSKDIIFSTNQAGVTNIPSFLRVVLFYLEQQMLLTMKKKQHNNVLFEFIAAKLTDSSQRKNCPLFFG